MTMRTKNQRQLYLDMQEHPDNYTDEQREAMMDDLDQMPDVQQAWQEFVQKTHPRQTHPQPLPEREGRSHLLTLRKIAAILLSVAFICGLAWTISTKMSHTEDAQTTKATAPLPLRERQEGWAVRFDDVRLDSILTVFSAHYGKKVHFRSDEAKAMKFIMTWRPDQPLADFIERMNMFDGLSLKLQQDTIIILTTEDKVSK